MSEKRVPILDGSDKLLEVFLPDSVPDKADLVVNVKDHGVVGNGVADDTTALQAAINAAPSGAEIFAPPGIYKFSTLTIDHGKTLRGAGWAALRDGLTVFGNSGYASNSNFFGTVFRSTATSGQAITCTTSGLTVAGGGLADFVLVGPGTGTSIGIKLGNDSPADAIVSAFGSNVHVMNFFTGIVFAYCEECRFDGMGARGCTNGVQLKDATNNNTFNVLEVQRCVTGFVDTALSVANVFYGFLGQANTGTSLVINGVSEQFYGGYFENSGSLTGLAIDVASSTCDGTILQGMQHTKATDGIRIRTGAVNTALLSPTGATAIPITNQGTGSFLQGDFATNFVLTDTGVSTFLLNTGTGEFTVGRILRIGSNTYNSSTVAINGAAGSSRAAYFETAGNLRFVVSVDGASESGASAGSNFAIVGCNDAGSPVHLTSCRRTDGAWTFPSTATVQGGRVILGGSAAPATPVGSGILWLDANTGALKFTGLSGTTTTLAPP